MKHLKGFNEGINFNDLLVDSYGDGIEDIKSNTVYIETNFLINKVRELAKIIKDGRTS